MDYYERDEYLGLFFPDTGDVIELSDMVVWTLDPEKNEKIFYQRGLEAKDIRHNRETYGYSGRFMHTARPEIGNGTDERPASPTEIIGLIHVASRDSINPEVLEELLTSATLEFNSIASHLGDTALIG